MSGPYRWDERNHFPLGVSIQASIPFTRVFLSDGGAVAVNNRAWYRLVRMPVVVPLAKPPKPSTSSHSAESETSDMGRVILVLAPRQEEVPLVSSCQCQFSVGKNEGCFEVVSRSWCSQFGQSPQCFSCRTKLGRVCRISRQSHFTFSMTSVSLQDVHHGHFWVL
jgi:hypothetical protein